MKAELERHWQAVAELGCVVTGTKPCTIHHAHGGSMKDRGVHRSMGRKTSDWLVMGLAFDLHVGNEGIDVIGVTRWEKKYGNQADYLDLIAEKLGVNVWEKAMADAKRMVPRLTNDDYFPFSRPRRHA